MRLTLSRTYHRFSDRPVTQWLSWVQKGGFAIADQGLFAGTIFIVNVLLARWMAPTDYGAFATSYSIFLLLATFHTAVLTEPMLIFGPGKFATMFRRYLAFLIYGHFGTTFIIGMVLAGFSGALYAVGLSAMAWALLGLALATPGILSLWILRRAFYVTGQVHWAASGGALYLGVMMGGTLTVHRTVGLSPFSAFVLMGLAGIVVSLWLVLKLKPAWQAGEQTLSSRATLSSHWEYGRWAAATAALSWLPGNIYYTLLPAWHGLEASATFKAIMNLVMPVLQVNAAISILIVPSFVRSLHAKGRDGLNKMLSRVLLVFLAISGAYWSFLFLLRSAIIARLYGGQYGPYADLLLLAGVVPFAAGMSNVFGGALRSLERPDVLFRCYFFSGLVAVTLGLWLTWSFGIEGAFLGMVITYFATAISAVWAFQGC